MRVNAWLFWALAAFFGLESAGYTLWQLHDERHMEWTGSIALTLSGVFSALIAFYLMVSAATGHRRHPQDDAEARIDDGDPEAGFFSPWSWWPLVLGFACLLIFAGFAAGVWISLIGGALGAVALVGWVYEYYRGLFAR